VLAAARTPASHG
ncbi:conserved hypothetical protein, partial [Bordetella bronchiseptica Bbr77]